MATQGTSKNQLHGRGDLYLKIKGYNENPEILGEGCLQQIGYQLQVDWEVLLVQGSLALQFYMQ